MAMPIPGVRAEAQMLKLSITLEKGVLLFTSDVSLVNKSDGDGAGQSAVFRFCDLPHETSEKVRSLIAEIEVHAGTRYFSGLKP